MHLKEWPSLLFTHMPQWSKYLDRPNLFVLDFIDYTLRGASQVVFQSNPISGILILVALFVQNPYFGLCATIGLVVETFMSVVYCINKNLIRAGLHGYNGILVGCACATFFGRRCAANCEFLSLLVLQFLSGDIEVSCGLLCCLYLPRCYTSQSETCLAHSPRPFLR